MSKGGGAKLLNMPLAKIFQQHRHKSLVKSTLGSKTFLPENICEKLTMPEFYMIFTPKYFLPNFFWLPSPVSYTHVQHPVPGRVRPSAQMAVGSDRDVYAALM